MSVLKLYHNARALTGIYGPDDVLNMPPQQRDIAVRSIGLASQGLEIIATSSTYRQGMKYAVNYTHASATFAASLLLRLARLFPANCDVVKVRRQVESLATLMAESQAVLFFISGQLLTNLHSSRQALCHDIADDVEARQEAEFILPRLLELCCPRPLWAPFIYAWCAAACPFPRRSHILPTLRTTPTSQP